ncbi:hypothetical protein V6N12_032571 [Hibiscus sabdariffa]|uniref:Bulb-type lectin domain-containing protein n=1 Tax=Hibiscus sabdariffa TaxID=183260 RepID=A0ABR2CD00_9ROSI
MNSVKWLIRILLIFFLSHFSISADTISLDHFIQDNNNEVIVSAGNIFELGFFSPGISTYRYVGIWYFQIPVKTPVWVANRDNPINDTSGVLRIDARGNLALFQGNQTLPVWSTNISIAGPVNSFAQILDSGNLVLLQNDSKKAVLWQSFGHPTNTWLSHMKIGFDLRTGLNQSYTSWKSPDDPGVGNISFRMNPGVSPQMVLYKGSVPLWRSGTWTGKESCRGHDRLQQAHRVVGEEHQSMVVHPFSKALPLVVFQEAIKNLTNGKEKEAFNPL